MKIMVLMLVLSLAVASCHKDSGKRANPFDNGDREDSFLRVETRSNADTLFLSWEEVDATLDFDSYRIVSDKPEQTMQQGREATGCLLTHVPYGEPVSVEISAMKGGQVVGTARVERTIDGLDRVFASMLLPDHGSVTSGDGTYSIALPDGRSIFLMGDSFTATVTGGARPRNAHMYRNSYILWDNGHVSAITGHTPDGGEISAAVPPGYETFESKWYWPGHGFVHDNKLYIFQTLMYNGGDGMWGFRYEKTHLLRYALPGVTLENTSDIPFSGSSDVHYGMAALDDGSYIYIYAQVDTQSSPGSEVLAARTTIGNLYTQWEYWNGSVWSASPSDAVKLAGLAGVAVCSQFNVFKLHGKYVLLTQNKNLFSPTGGEIYTFTSNNPQGPWGNKKTIFDTYENKPPYNLMTYNAMAHPQFEREGLVPVSYNVNTEDGNRQADDVSTYRPRFFWVEIDRILNN